jgi:RNA polymerase sigma-70 factor, ECF subfamily
MGTSAQRRQAMDTPLDQPSVLSSKASVPEIAGWHVPRDAGPAADELTLLDALRRGDESAFTLLVDRYHTALLRLALAFVSNRAIAEEVVQDTWLGVLGGLGRFEGRSSLRTWIFRILANKAKTRAQREGRTIPFSSLPDLDLELDGPSVEPDRFLPPDHAQWPGHWATPAQSWEGIPEERLLAQETRACIQDAIDALPPLQREVITLRDVEGCTAEEACHILSVTETHQRVLLHRARSRVRGALERYFEET